LVGQTPQDYVASPRYDDRHYFWHDVKHSLALVSVLAAAVDLEETLSDSSRRRLGLLRDELRFLGRMTEVADATPRPTLVALDVVVQDAVALMAEVYPADLTVEVEPATVPLDAPMGRRLVGNLLENALVAVGGGGRVAVELRREGERALLLIADSGRGFGPSGMPSVGCGLATVLSLVTSIGGSVSFGSSRWGGAQVVVALPLA
jgi:signal transduction histidine kinase